MTEFIGTYLSTIVVGLILFFILALVSRKMILDKKNAKGGCGCNCAGCSGTKCQTESKMKA